MVSGINKREFTKVYLLTNRITMSKKEKLIYKVSVDPNTEYTIKARIGDAQDGDHNVFGNCPYSIEPENDNPEWISLLGLGSAIKGKVLYISSSTIDSNPHTNNVSVRIFINNVQIEPKSGNFVLNVNENDIVKVSIGDSTIVELRPGQGDDWNSYRMNPAGAGLDTIIVSVTLNGCTSYDSLPIEILDTTRQQVINDTTSCESVTLFTDVDTALGGIYEWRSLTPFATLGNADSIVITTSGAYDLFVDSLGNGCGAYSDFTVTIVDSVHVFAGLDTTICDNSLQLYGSVTPNDSSIVWATLGDGIFNDVNDTSTIYNLGTTDIANNFVDVVIDTLFTNVCYSGPDTMRITISPLPTVDEASVASGLSVTKVSTSLVS